MSGLAPLAGLGISLRRGFGRITPEPFVLAVSLTVLVALVAALGNDGGADVTTVLRAWASGAGLWQLGRFAMQISVMLVLGSALADAKPVRALLARIVGLARSPRQLVALTAFVACVLALLNWSLGLIGGAVLAREAGGIVRERGWRLHYPLVCAAGYSGLMVWHGGLSGSAPLKVTRTAEVIDVLGPELGARLGAVGLDQTLFGGLNLVVSGGLLLLAPLVFAALTPDQALDPGASLPPVRTLGAGSSEADSPVATKALLLDRIDDAPLWTCALALLLSIAVVMNVSEQGWMRLDLDTVNAGLFACALVAQWRPRAFFSACERGGRACAGVIVLFPLYAGIMAIMSVSGLGAAATRVVGGVGPEMLSIVTFASAGLVNLFVPSGGGQWALQGPIIMQAALDTGASPASIVMALAYGDQLTNMLQPFWALPLLSMTGVKARDIVGYCTIWMVTGGLYILAMLWLLA